MQKKAQQGLAMSSEFFISTLSPTIPRLLQSLCQKVYEYGVQYGDTKAVDISQICDPKLYAPFCFDFHIPNADKSDAVDVFDEECELLEKARFLASEAIRLCTGHMISTLRTRSNQYNATYRLPNEVLSLIFQFIERSSANPLCPLRKRAPHNIAAVSRLWREVALNTPSLWTRIDVMPPWLTRVFLRRSKEEPLRIEVDANELDEPGSWASPWLAQDADEESGEGSEEEGEDVGTHEDGSNEEDVDNDVASDYSHPAPVQSRFSRFIELLKPTVHRWASMELHNASTAEVVQTLHFPLPRLEFLCMTRHAYELDTATYLRAIAPRLRDFHLVAVPISLASPIYAGLTSLRLEDDVFGASTIRQLFGALAACPDLESLTLINYRFDDPHSADTSNPSIPIILNRLQHLQLERVEGRLPKAILDSISVPSTVTLNANMEVISWAEAMVPMNVANAPRVRHMIITIRRTNGGASVYTIIGEASEEGPILLEIRYNPGRTALYNIDGHKPDILRHLGHGKAFSSLKSLTLSEQDSERHVDGPKFAEMLGNFPSLEKLALH
ncbi:hypothetical protein BOTBODRAFT_38905 [Botryobasidium botryosum FD-172 SS1]|uniref:F-box domain-containing protein n=1 Tax=Botryobasidium botryosum (strain FD-172 SS1) TaxID=930990 RepID=A0A067M608_BOTB1|nr:hypothetical protein BOTBODRAFT_38905 [Botryobasidium botryosum FD-172 SS1]